jgi:hypothetical protein
VNLPADEALLGRAAVGEHGDGGAAEHSQGLPLIRMLSSKPLDKLLVRSHVPRFR